MVRVDIAYYEEFAGLLRGLLIRLSDRRSDKDLLLIAGFIDANELGLALDHRHRHPPRQRSTPLTTRPSGALDFHVLCPPARWAWRILRGVPLDQRGSCSMSWTAFGSLSPA
jgi:hypothetical protein